MEVRYLHLVCFTFTEKELATPPLNGLILPGITRHSIIQTVQEWNEFRVRQRVITMSEVIELQQSNRVSCLFIYIIHFVNESPTCYLSHWLQKQRR